METTEQKIKSAYYIRAIWEIRFRQVTTEEYRRAESWASLHNSENIPGYSKFKSPYVEGLVIEYLEDKPVSDEMIDAISLVGLDRVHEVFLESKNQQRTGYRLGKIG